MFIHARAYGSNAFFQRLSEEQWIVWWKSPRQAILPNYSCLMLFPIMQWKEITFEDTPWTWNDWIEDRLHCRLMCVVLEQLRKSRWLMNDSRSCHIRSKIIHRHVAKKQTIRNSLKMTSNALSIPNNILTKRLNLTKKLYFCKFICQETHEQ